MSYLPLTFEASDIFPRKCITLRPGIHIMMSSGILENSLERKNAATASIFELSYNRRDALHGEVGHKSVELKPGYASLGFLNQACGHSEYDSGVKIHLYSIWVSPTVFNDFCRAAGGSSCADFHTFQQGAYYNCNFKTSPREESILYKMDDCFNHDTGEMNLLFLESQILELMSLNLERLFGKNDMEHAEVSLSRSDIDSLILAHEILLSRLQNPPSLLELSRLLQMNDCKLKRTFKHYYGQTVYGFIRNQRLEKAFSLIENQHLNVSQAAFSVGYTNTGHFSQSFFSKFGVYPSQLARR